MRQGGPNGRRPRGRHHGGHGGHGGHDRHDRHSGGNSGPPGGMSLNPNRPRSAAALRHQTFDSHCLDVRVRGNAWQVYEKYQQLARDANGSGDRVAAENYLQHAEHYFRIIEAINDATASEQRQRGGAPASPFGEQPTTPSGYYGSEGGLAQPPATDAAGNPAAAAAGAGAPQGQAEVTQKNPPAAQSPFFDEPAEEQNEPQSRVAQR